jgi:hypothetical protein
MLITRPRRALVCHHRAIFSPERAPHKGRLAKI